MTYKKITCETTKKNLNLVIKVLEKTPQSNFDMRYYLKNKTDHDIITFKDYLKRDFCGTSGCVLGMCAFSKIKELQFTKECFPYRCIEIADWDEYSRIKFPFINGQDWSFLFSPYWCGHDNSPYGAVQRVKLCLEKGIPQDWDWHDYAYGWCS